MEQNTEVASQPTLVLKGSEWPGRGWLFTGEGMGGVHGSNGSNDNKFCCLGIDGKECGLTPEDMHGCGLPNDYANLRAKVDGDLSKLDPKVTAWIKRWCRWNGDYWAPTELAQDAATINDSTTFDTAEKYQRLVPIFAQVGIKLVWEPNL